MPPYSTIQGRENEAAEHTISNGVCFYTSQRIIAAEKWAKDLPASHQADFVRRAVNPWSLIALATSTRDSAVTA